MMTQSDIANWLIQVQAEYLEMPGLSLTERQMQRLWGLDQVTCSMIVGALVGSGFLLETSRRAYVLNAHSLSRRH